MTSILLVTGSRALGDTVAAGRWAWDILEPMVRAADLVVTGDAPGPDTWAAELCRLRGRSYRTFALDGHVYGAEWGLAPQRLWSWHDDPTEGRKDHGRRWPLMRNRHLVAQAKLAQGRGSNVRVVALHAPWAATHGTGYTVVVARRAGLAVSEHHCPAELAPAIDGAT